MTLSHTQQLTRDIFACLNGEAEYAVLRNYEQLPMHNPGRDIDIVIRRRDFRRVRAKLARMIDGAGWRIVTCLRSDRLETIVCGKIAGPQAELIQWDFFFDTSLFGIRLMDAGEMIGGRLFNGEVYHVRPAVEFLDKFLYVRVVGGQYPQKYDNIKHRAADDPAIKTKLESLFGCETIEAAEHASGRKLLLSALWSNLKKRPAGQIGGLIRFAASRVWGYLRSDAGWSIGFTGPDGAGKTTVIETMHRMLSPVFGEAALFHHFRPALLPNLGEAAHAAGVKKEVDREFDKPHRGGRKGVVNSLIRLCYYTADYITGYLVRVKPQLRITRMVVFDRYYTDVVADSRRRCIYLDPRFLYLWGRLFIPALGYNILLTADTGRILARKQELDREGIENIGRKLDYLSAKRGYYLILNDETPEAAAESILNIVFEGQHKKNMKKFRADGK